MDATGSSFVEFWSDASERGLMNPNTAGSYRSAAESVLSSQSNWETIDIRRLDVDHAVTRFRQSAGNYLSEATMRTYESNFRRAVPSFVSYLNDPNGWSPPVRPRRSTTLALAATSSARPAEVLPRIAPAEEMQQSTPVDLPIPLPDGRTARLVLPGRLTPDDRELLKQVIPLYLDRMSS